MYHSTMWIRPQKQGGKSGHRHKAHVPVNDDEVDGLVHVHEVDGTKTRWTSLHMLSILGVR